MFRTHFFEISNKFFVFLLLISSPFVESTVCSANEFMCDQRCLPMEYRCNGFNECNDGTDERDCPEIGKFDFFAFLHIKYYRCYFAMCYRQNFRCKKLLQIMVCWGQFLYCYRIISTDHILLSISFFHIVMKLSITFLCSNVITFLWWKVIIGNISVKKFVR